MRIPKGGIAFFDSGIGGLTVLNECQKRLHGEIFYYYGDNRRAPYGNRPAKQVKKFVDRAVKKLLRLRIKALVLACNTATAICVEDLRKKYRFPIIGAEPAVLKAGNAAGEVFVLSTRATYKSSRFQELMKRAGEKFPFARWTPKPCEQLASTIEKNVLNPNFNYEPFLPKGSPKAVVLGCTHYIYIKEQIARFYGCDVFDGNEGIAARLESLLEKKTEKGRDEQPLVTPPATTSLITPKNSKNKGRVFFLGSKKNHNSRIFEQMFVKCRK